MLCAARSIEHEEYARSRNKGASFGNKAPTTIAKREKQMKIQVLFALSSVLAGVLSGAGICTVYAQGGQVREIGLAQTGESSDTRVKTSISVNTIHITEPGNYRLNANLSSAHAVIQIESSDVTLDLNGFNIASAGPGIVGAGDNIAILNGSIRPGDGVAVGLRGSNCRIEQLRVGGGRFGFDIRAEGDEGTGCLVKNNTVNAASLGISCIGCVLSGNTVTANFQAIRASNASLVLGNRVTGGQVALTLDDTTGYAENVLRGGQIDVTGGVQIGENLCVTNKFCAP